MSDQKDQKQFVSDPFFRAFTYLYDTPENEQNGLPDGFRIGTGPVYEARLPPAKPAAAMPRESPDGTYEYIWSTADDFINYVPENFLLIMKIGAAPNHELLHLWDGVNWPRMEEWAKQNQDDNKT